MKYESLNDLISAGEELTEGQKESLYRLVAYRCRRDTKERLRRRIDLPLVLWENHGIYSRVHLKSDGTFSYCAGQHYPSEIATVRDCILGRS